jgi:hypothetical protein
MSFLILSNGGITLADSDTVQKFADLAWSRSAGGYAWNHKIGFLHRQILEPKPGLDIDHINRDKLDNRRQNLRYLTRSQNCINSSDRYGTASKIRGVCKSKSIKFPWCVKFKRNYKTVIVGYYKNLTDASAAATQFLADEQKRNVLS